MESKFSKLKVNNEIQLCKVKDKNLKNAVEKALLEARVSYFIKWEKPSFFFGTGGDSCIFCVNEGQAETAQAAIEKLGDTEGRIKFIFKKGENHFSR